MTREYIEKRIDLIEKEIAQTIANHSRLLGHLAEARHWLETFLKDETTDAQDNINVPVAEPEATLEQTFN